MAGSPDGFGTTTEELERASRHVRSVNETVQTELSTLRSKLGPLAGAWTGAAAAQFQNLMVRWDADARSLNQALGSIGDAIQSSGVSYQHEEDLHRARMSSITAALG